MNCEPAMLKLVSIKEVVFVKHAGVLCSPGKLVVVEMVGRRGNGRGLKIVG